jgi:uncharacterized protein involved in exopolysaccharide biosynthesis
MTVTSPVNQSGVAMVHEYAGIALREKWLILGCVTLSVALAWAYCFIAPQYYRSETLIVAEEQNRLETSVREQGKKFRTATLCHPAANTESGFFG